MKLSSCIAAALLATASFSALASQEVSLAQSTKLHEIKMIGISGIHGSPTDAEMAIKDNADKSGAPYYRIVSMGTPSKSSVWFGEAMLYN